MIRLLDGAVGTELARRGFVLRAPAFSAAAIVEAPALLGAIHAEHTEAGAELVTAGTTCVHRSWVGERCGALAAEAIAIARAAVGDRARVAGAVAALPREVDAVARVEQYRETAVALAAAGADVLVCESFVDPSELALAVHATADLGVERWAAIVAGPSGDALDGTPIERVLELDVEVIAVHCCTVAAATAALTRLRAAQPGRVLAAYPCPGDAGDAELARELVVLAERLDLAWLGACCGSTPATIAALAAARDRSTIEHG